MVVNIRPSKLKRITQQKDLVELLKNLIKNKMSKTKKLGVAKKTPKTKKLACHLEVEVNDLVYKGDAETLDQCLKGFVNSPNFPSSIKTRAIIRFSEGEKQGQVVWPTIRARRQFNLMSLKPYWSELVAGRFESNLAM